MSPPGRPKGEYRSAQRVGSVSCPPGRPKGLVTQTSRSAQRVGSVSCPPGRRKGLVTQTRRSAQRADTSIAANLPAPQ